MFEIKSSYCSNSSLRLAPSCPGVAVTSQILCISITLNKRNCTILNFQIFYKYLYSSSRRMSIPYLNFFAQQIGKRLLFTARGAAHSNDSGRYLKFCYAKTAPHSWIMFSRNAQLVRIPDPWKVTRVLCKMDCSTTILHTRLHRFLALLMGILLACHWIHPICSFSFGFFDLAI